MLKYFGVNRAIGFGLMTRGWSTIAGPITMVLIASTLTNSEQGYYYTFASLLALQVFFELGLVTVLAQFVSHEFVSLSWGNRGQIVGDEDLRNRVLDILGKSLKWYSVCAFLLIASLSVAGFLFFRSEMGIDSSWKLPWFLAVFGVGINLLIIPFYAVISGSGDVASVNLREFFGAMLGSLCGWAVLFLGGGLYAIPAVTIGNIVIGVIYLSKKYPALLKQGINFSIGKKNIFNPISWRHEVFPMQWKIALSWISGYFIFNLFTPVLFKFHGPVIAGQMGMTLAAINSIQAVCLIWPSSKMPELGKLIAMKNWVELDFLFKKTLRSSITVCLFLLSLFLIILWLLKTHYQLGERFLSLFEVFIFSVSIFCQILISSWVFYMRAHKQEPMIFLSIIGALLTGVSTIVGGYYFSSIGMAIGYLLINITFGIPFTYILFKKFKNLNHN